MNRKIAKEIILQTEAIKFLNFVLRKNSISGVYDSKYRNKEERGIKISLCRQLQDLGSR